MLSRCSELQGSGLVPEGASEWAGRADVVQCLRNDSVLLAFILTTNAGSFAYFCLKRNCCKMFAESSGANNNFILI